MFQWRHFGHHGRGKTQNGSQVYPVNQDLLLDEILMAAQPVKGKPRSQWRMLLTLENVIALGKAWIWIAVPTIFYLMIQSSLAENKQTMKEQIEIIKTISEETRQQQAERHKRMMEAK